MSSRSSCYQSAQRISACNILSASRWQWQAFLMRSHATCLRDQIHNDFLVMIIDQTFVRTPLLLITRGSSISLGFKFSPRTWSKESMSALNAHCHIPNSPMGSLQQVQSLNFPRQPSRALLKNQLMKSLACYAPTNSTMLQMRPHPLVQPRFSSVASARVPLTPLREHVAIARHVKISPLRS